MLSTRAKVILIVLCSIPVLLGLGLVACRLTRVPPDTPLTRAPPTALNVLHYNDGYDVRKTPRFLTRWIERLEPDSLTLFSGDIIAPSLVSQYMKGSQFLPFMRLSDTQVAVPGNHEYDFGEEVFETFKKSGSTLWLIANLKVKGSPDQTVSGLKEHEVRTVRGYKVCVFGLIDTNWQRSNKLDAEKFDYEPFDAAAKRKGAELRGQGCDFVFVVSHMANASDEQLLADQNDVDMVFGGHDHIFYVRRINDKLLLKSGTDFETFSQVKMFFTESPPGGDYCAEKCAEFNYLLDEEINDGETFFNFTLPRGKRYLNVAIEKVRMRNEDAKHAEMTAFIKAQVDPQIREFLQPMVRLDSRLDTRETNIQNRETAVGNLFADLARAHYGTDLGVVNAGIFKAEKLFDKNIFLRKIDLMKIFPYKRDVFVVLELTGAEILEVLETSLKTFPKPSPHFLSWSGLTYEVDPTAEPGKRVVSDSVVANGVPLDRDKVYSVALVSGLQHPKFGIELLKTKISQTPEPERVEPAALFEDFTRLVEKSDQASEFSFFRSQFPGKAFEKVSSIPVKARKGSEVFSEGAADDPEDLSRLERVSPAALKRLRQFALADEVVSVDGRSIFAISPAVDKRFKIAAKIVV